MTTSRLDHERGLAAFLVARRRARFRASLEDPRTRRKLLGDLYHFEGYLDPRFATRHEQHVKHDSHMDEVHVLLVAEGAPATCFVLATVDLDGQEASLNEAVSALMWTGAGCGLPLVRPGSAGALRRRGRLRGVRAASSGTVLSLGRV
jgi:hypothetical protein